MTKPLAGCLVRELGERRGVRCDPALAAGLGLQFGTWSESEAQGCRAGGKPCYDGIERIMRGAAEAVARAELQPRGGCLQRGYQLWKRAEVARLLVPAVGESPLLQRGRRVYLGHRARPVAVDRTPRVPQFREQSRAAHGSVPDSVRGDAERDEPRCRPYRLLGVPPGPLPA